MQNDRWQQVQDLFDQALALPVEEREPFLATSCDGDTALHAEVAAMLAADATGEGFLEDTVAGGAALATEALEPTPQPRRFGKYQILDKLGEGGYGQVYEAFDPILGRQVAIKICTSENPKLRERFHREARIAASLQHPNIVTVHDYGLEKDIPFLVQELLSGEDLAHVIKRRQSLPLAMHLDYLLQIARGLAHAHDNGVLHRDVKPANVRVLEDGRVKILDFGIARLSGSASRLTGKGKTVGTVGYLAPEQMQGQDPDQRSDIFAFGVLAYELLAHDHPFAGDDFAQMSQRLLREKPRPLRQRQPECPRPLEALIMRCLAKAPSQRYGTFAEVVAALEAIAEKEATGESGPGAATGWGQQRWPAAAAVTFVVAAAILVTARFQPAPTREPSVELASAKTTEADAAEKQAEPEAQQAEPEKTLADSETAEAQEPSPSDVDTTEEPGTKKARADEELPAQPARAAEQPSLINEVPPALRRAAAPPSNPSREGEAEASTGVATVAPPPPPTNAPPQEDARRKAAQVPKDSPTESAATAEPSLPELLNHPEPRYPPGARRRGREAQVIIAVLVNEKGEVTTSVVKSTTDTELGFVEAAREAAGQARFRPATRAGEHVRMWTEITFDFKLPPGAGS